jgi:hypothetical protein
MKTITLSSFDFPKSNTKFSITSVKEYLKKKETKVLALLSYWGVETMVNLFALATLFLAGQYALALGVIAITLFETYALLGAVYEII